MTTAISLGGPEHATSLLSLMARYHEEMGLGYDDEHRAAVTLPLLEGSPLGAFWLIGPQRAPLGYVMVTFGWSVALGGMVAWVEEVFIRPSVRSRGIGTEVLHAVAVSLGQVNIRALHARVGDDARLMRFCSKVGFSKANELRIMTDIL